MIIIYTISMTKHSTLLWKRAYIERILTLTYPVKEWKKIQSSIPIKDACREVWISDTTLYSWLQKDSKLKALWDEAQQNRMIAITDKAKENIYKAVDWEMGLKKKDLVDISFRFLEKTNREYQPTNQVEMKSMNMNFDVPIEELEERIKSIMNK